MIYYCINFFPLKIKLGLGGICEIQPFGMKHQWWTSLTKGLCRVLYFWLARKGRWSSSMWQLWPTILEIKMYFQRFSYILFIFICLSRSACGKGRNRSWSFLVEVFFANDFFMLKEECQVNRWSLMTRVSMQCFCSDCLFLTKGIS